MPSPLHTHAPTTRFSDRAEAYRLYRPSYPTEAIGAILHGLPPSTILTAADIGAGTGISARLLADRGLRVIAVEPNPDMAAAADPHPNIEWRTAPAEATGLPADSLDLILCAQAFHWFNADEALVEFHRILRPGARLALMWNDRDNTDPLTAAYGRAVETAADHHPAAHKVVRPDPLFSTPLFGPVTEHAFRYEQPLTREALIGRALSASYIPKSGPRHDALITTLTDLHAQHADPTGHVRLVYNTVVYLAHCKSVR